MTVIDPRVADQLVRYAPSVAADALATAGAMAIQMLELEPLDLATVNRCVPPAIVSMAWLMMETDPVFAPRFKAAGDIDDWLEQGRILHEAILWLLTPERVPAELAS